MMARGIEAGDVVQVVRDCCGEYVGIVFTVGRLQFHTDPYMVGCTVCGFSTTDTVVAQNKDFVYGQHKIYCAPVGWLRRLEPPGEDVGEINKLYLPSPKRETVEAK